MKDQDGYFYIDEYGRKCRNETDEVNEDKEDE